MPLDMLETKMNAWLEGGAVAGGSRIGPTVDDRAGGVPAIDRPPGGAPD